jgi:hypothetical protein
MIACIDMTTSTLYDLSHDCKIRKYRHLINPVPAFQRHSVDIVRLTKRQFTRRLSLTNHAIRFNSLYAPKKSANHAPEASSVGETEIKTYITLSINLHLGLDIVKLHIRLSNISAVLYSFHPLLQPVFVAYALVLGGLADENNAVVRDRGRGQPVYRLRWIQ